MRKCHFCDRDGDWPKICMSTRDMEEKGYDAICDAKLLELGGGERSVNQARAAKLRLAR